ncbi:zinc finger CCCH domain-containing protein 44 isoform X1 [Ziziphus jujuba]|uniref:Zinc finger CCCH domain-containing protein 44 isoform X1 n=1 Tax=Ziziphus jujuba TaxID=326968 RepID=A0A6P4ALK8_ZIZJJ|nr:zinc finger CCCH domain-containing protein 44 isoform X1 [Ziziphus jujuba]
MEQQEEVQGSSLYKPCIEDEEPKDFDQSVQGLELMSVDQCETIGDLDDSQLVGAPLTVADGCDRMAAGENGFVVNVEVKLAEKTVEKRRRGRPPRGLVKTTPLRKKKDEEDVCFICFDGGSLVLCDRRGCPKAYHPACIKRDESFFRSKAKWNCGWHICSSCRKASHYMCYTCTYSLCKGCTKDADYLCVRGSKGLCGTCMRTVMLIENLQGCTEMAKVDFDDKSSWEYLFKVYWIFLKRKLSLTLDELIRAKNPWKGPPVIASKGQCSSGFYYGSNKNSISGNSYADLEVINLKRKTTKKPNALSEEDCLGIGKLGGGRVTFSGDTIWASKALLEFVAHMKNGDTSILSQFDVQALLLEYIKRNNLRDPRRKCQIICDSRLLNLFGKACVGHIEMLKLLESHFLIKEGPRADNSIQDGCVDAVCSHGNSDSHTMMVNDKKRKTRKRVDEQRQQTNPDAYAAIDVHNINLIFLRRNLVENLIDDADKFHDKVVGSFVRIKISSGDQKQDMHRLVQVVGTSKVMEPYNVGTKTTDLMLEISNLNKKEVISIDGISNQEFDQDDCKRLRQSIKCGLIKRLTVGEIQEKAVTLQAAKVNDWLEAEVLRLNHLRDRASEKGHRKELKECVEKLQLLNSPEERQRRLQEFPVVHSDPNMDPNCESEDNDGEIDENKKDNKVKPRNSSFGRKRREPVSPRSGADGLITSGSKAQKTLATPPEQKRGKEKIGSNGCKTAINQANHSDPAICGRSTQATVGSDTFSGAAAESTGVLSAGMNQSVNDFETDKIWHYQDPSGKIQGPFNMLQLRKWSATRLFPSDLRIWKLQEKQDDAILLTEVLNVHNCQEPLLRSNSHLPSEGIGVASDRKDNGRDRGWNKSMNSTPVDGKRVEESTNFEQDDPSKHKDENSEPMRSNGWGPLSSSCTTLADVNSNEEHTGIFPQGWDSFKENNAWPNQPQVCSSLPTPVFPVNQTSSHHVREGHESEKTSDQNNENLNAHQTAEGHTNNGRGCENQSDSEGHSGQSSSQNWRPPPVNGPSNGWDSNAGFTSVAKSLETSEQNKEEIDFPDFPSPTRKQGNGDLECQAAENRQSASPNAPVQDAGLSWSTASSLIGGGTQLHEVAGEWGGYSSTTAKPSVEEWESSIVSVSSLKPTEMASDHAGTPASISEQLTHSSPSHPASSTSGWHAIVAEPNEFSSLADESVSDLLAEVEAMESLKDMASSPTIINCGGELTEGSKNDCLSSVEGFSPPPDPGKGDALSSTGDIHLPPRSTMSDEPLGVGKADVLDPQNRSNGHSATSVEVEGDAKHSDVSVNQWEVQPAAPSTAGWDVAAIDTTWNARSESANTDWGAVQGNPSIGWGGLDQGSAVMAWGACQGTAQENSNTNSGTGTPTGNIWGSQPRYGGERYFGPRDRIFQGRDSGYGRGRHVWNRQQFGGGNGGGPFRPPSKGQRVCKFHESGYCKKGASCSYLHP